MNIDDKKHEELQIENIEKDNNAKKPFAILILISSFFFGAFLGVAMCFLSDFIGNFEGLSFGEAWLSIQKYLTIPTRALYVVGDLVLLGVVLFFYRKAMKTWKTNTDEDEKYEKTDKYISLFMILVSFANCFNLSVFGVALYNKPGVITLLNELYGDTISKIVPKITDYSAVTTTRNDVNYIVTEFGIAQLKGKTMRERARALIAIAHPDFRDELCKEFEKRFNEKY